MKSFRIKYSPLIILLLALCLAIFILGITISFINLFKSLDNTIDIVKYSFLILLNFALIVFTVSVFVYGKYTIKNEDLILHIGIIATKYKIKEIVSINIFKKTNKLVIYFINQKYTVIIIPPKKYDEFILELRSKNREITFSENTEGENE